MKGLHRVVAYRAGITYASVCPAYLGAIDAMKLRCVQPPLRSVGGTGKRPLLKPVPPPYREASTWRLIWKSLY